ncbi:MAG: PAS domain S-box protein [Steroidobacteraceae bacterium]
MNEYLQCANEELETSKEELQSLNEGLSSFNTQLEGKVSDLDAANNDLSNRMIAIDIAIVFLDRELRIKGFTPPAGRLLDLMPSDVGRSFNEIAQRLTDDRLLQDSHRVIATGTALDREIRLGGNRGYLRRILPHRAADGPIGLVITFIDVTERLEAETQSRRLAAVLRDSSDAIVLIDLDGRITAWNRGAETMYGYTEADAVTMSLYDLVTEEGREHTREIIMRVAQGEVLPAFEAHRRTRDGRVIDVWATITLLRDASDKPALFATTERNVTVERRSARQMRAILDATPDAVVTIDRAGKIDTFNLSAVRLFGYRADEVIGQSVGLLMPPRASLQHGEYLDRYLQTRERHVIGTARDVNARHKDGTLFPVCLYVIEIEHLGLFVGFIHDMTATKTLREEILKIAILEQQRIGQELHDGTQQELTGLGLLAHDLSEALSRQGSQTEAKLAARLASGIAQANLHVRSLAHGLVPVPVDAETLPAALGELARSTRATYGLSCQFDCPEPLQVGIASTATHLYRIAQEAVGNAAKHAKAEAISIRLRRTEADLVLEIADNGIGIVPGRAPHEGAGLRLMEYRCAVIGGCFKVQQQESGGTLVACAIPLSGRS